MYNHVQWNTERRIKRKNILKEMLGNKCVKCGSSDNLQFDHIIPEEKLFNISESLTKNWDILLKETKKCQLLCLKCHRIKSIDYIKSHRKHGTEQMYRYYCRCKICVDGFAKMRSLRPSRQKGYIKPQVAGNPPA